MIVSIDDKMHDQNQLNTSINHCNCPIEATLKVIGGKWKPIILCLLSNNTLRYNKIQQLIPNISPKMLTKQLRELQNDGLVLRKVHSQIPPKVEYSITEYGLTVLPILESLYEWGTNNLDIKCILNK